MRTLRAALLLLLCAPLAAATSQRPADARADSLTVAEFAALSARLSEPAGYFDTDNLISNEGSYLHALTFFDRLGLRGGGYVGVGPDQSFSYIARVRPRIAYIVDIRRDNLLHHLLLKSLFALSRNRAEYVALWLGKPVPPDVAAWSARNLASLVAWADTARVTAASADAAVRRVRERVTSYGVPLSREELATIERFHREFIRAGTALQFTSTGRSARAYYPTLRQLLLERDLAGNPGHYLVREEDFAFLKELQRRNLVVPVVGDLGGPRALRAIGADLRARGERLSVLYVSNVEDYLIRDGRFAEYVTSVTTLPVDDRSVIVRSWFGGPMSHPASVPDYWSTQLVHPVRAFLADSALRRVTSYRALVARGYLPLPSVPRR